ncbi:Transcriptional regulator, TetR family [Candidatus Burkholderia verschuerenii]|uniref:Transcriptional regulator, TetR family n=1 Tax=Candidatus Burkholderia verschuerenii TaxID=242163 RepID=A0A0L0M5R7_9BURK|nr:TetR/AcrR family transcriptional regulator [Candidatus Burkholderia verschuerenii]KND57615.1 Transcriptional regulator, TetR family [Candidatus Burkholderia verschuerenii]
MEEAIDRTDKMLDTTRGSAEVWLGAAYDALLEGGVDAVSVHALSKRLNISRTSFYWFFKDKDELLSRLLAKWKKTNTGNWISRTEAYAESIAEAILNVFDCWFDEAIFDSRFEAAIRSWAQQSPAVARELAEDDGARIAALTAMFARFNYDPKPADVRARTAYFVQVGYVSTHQKEELSVRMDRIPEYVEVFTGKRAKKNELERFYSRRGFK